MPVDLFTLVAAMTVTFVAALVQGTIGIGLGMLSVPVLSLIDPVLAPVPQLIITLPLTFLMMKGERHAIDWRAVVRVSSARIPGIAAGVGLLSFADERLLDLMIGLIVFLAVVTIGMGVTVRRNKASELVAGVVSGTTGTISSIGGPPLALLYREDSGPAVRSNLAAIFAIGIAMMLGARIVSGFAAGTDFEVALWLAPAVAGGYLVARRMQSRVEGTFLRVAILAVCALAASGLIYRALAG